MTYEGDWTTRGPETSWNGEWELVGEDGRLIWTAENKEDRNLGEVVVELWGELARKIEQPHLSDTGRSATLQALRAAIEEGVQPETVAADNLKSLAVVMGCVNSIENGVPVDVAELLREASGEEIPEEDV